MIDNLDNGNCNERNLRQTSRAPWILFNARKDRPRRKKRMLSGNIKNVKDKIENIFLFQFVLKFQSINYIDNSNKQHLV